MKKIYIGRRNSVEISVKGLILAVTVVISLAISAMGFLLVTKARSAVDEGTYRFSSLMDEYGDITVSLYDGMRVSGERVADVIDEMTREDRVAVIVMTKMNLSQSGVNAGTVYGGSGWTGYVSQDMNKVLRTSSSVSPYENENIRRNDADYINPDATFEGKVTKNENGVVTAIRFTQI